MANSKEKFKKSLREFFRKLGIASREKHREYIARVEPFIPIALFVKSFYSAYYFISRALDFFSKSILRACSIIFFVFSLLFIKTLEDAMVFTSLAMVTIVIGFIAWKAANLDFSKYKKSASKKSDSIFYVLGYSYIIAVSIDFLVINALSISNGFIGSVNTFIEKTYTIFLYPILFIIILVLGSFWILAGILTITGLSYLTKKIKEINSGVPWKKRVQLVLFWLFIVTYFIVVALFWKIALYITIMIAPIMLLLPAAIAMRVLFAKDENDKFTIEARLGKTLAEEETARLKRELRKKQKMVAANAATA